MEPIEDLHERVFTFLYQISLKDPNFRFTLRKSNKESRLSKGYFFYGNEHYLAVSFWSGTDWKNKTPNINFVIVPSRTETFLEISVSDSIEKLAFINSFLMIPELSLEQRGTKFYKDLHGESYLIALQNFINQEKILIDQIVAKNQDFFKDLDLENRIDFIDGSLFRLRLLNALTYRKQVRFNKTQKWPCYLSDLNIEKFYGINHIEIKDLPNNTQWIFLTGINGSGKSSILKALTLTLCPNTKEYLDFEDPGHFKISTKLHRGDTKVKVECRASKMLTGNDFFSGGFAAYGPSRLVVSDRSTKVKISKSELEKKQTASYSIFHPDGVLLDFSNEIESLFKRSEVPKTREKLGIIIETLIECIDSLSKIFLEHLLPGDQKHLEDNIVSLYIEKDENGKDFTPVKYFQLSSGTKSLIAMLGDMMIRLFAQQPEIYDIGELKGIVLIDEIDIHFHPKQQRNLITALTNSFPNIQFIVTTHSPVPLLGAPNGSVFLTVKRDAEKGVQIERLVGIEEDIGNMLPNLVYTSELFGLQDIRSMANADENDIMTQDDMLSALEFKEQKEKYKLQSINDLDFLEKLKRKHL